MLVDVEHLGQSPFFLGVCQAIMEEGTEAQRGPVTCLSSKARSFGAIQVLFALHHDSILLGSDYHQ